MNGKAFVRALFALGVVVCLCVARPAAADVRILSSAGGSVGEFLRAFQALRESGERVIIDGPCLSACTLVVIMVPRDRICVTRRAVLGFHAARGLDEKGRLWPEPRATRVVLAAYPAPIRSWIVRHGGLTSRLILLRGPALRAMYPSCR
jgi:hypothetical protein